jgi:Calcineurin-like phosphoesterase
VFGAIALAALALAAPGKTLVAAGDIADCTSSGDEQTAAIVARTSGTVAALGDEAYDTGSAEEFARCYAPSWGRFRGRTRPAVGNHEYLTEGAAGYFAYFGARAAPPGGWYSYDLGAWHAVVLNSNCGPAGGCEQGSAQEQWLRADLAAHPARCTLAYWHHPRYSSGPHGDDATVEPFWRDLAAARADVVLSGHDHDYERFAPKRGIREFVVGTGGRSHYPILRRTAGSVVRNWTAYGVLRLTLRPAGYSWRFLPVRGASFTDGGSARCR